MTRYRDPREGEVFDDEPWVVSQLSEDRQRHWRMLTDDSMTPVPRWANQSMADEVRFIQVAAQLELAAAFRLLAGKLDETFGAKDG